MGEGPQLGDDEWPALLRTVVQVSRGRVPVVGAIHSKDTVRSIWHAREAQELGAAALEACEMGLDPQLRAELAG